MTEFIIRIPIRAEIDPTDLLNVDLIPLLPAEKIHSGTLAERVIPRSIARVHEVEVMINEVLEGGAELDHTHPVATEVQAGFMSAEDKRKLDDLPEEFQQPSVESIPGLQSALDSKAEAEHTHSVNDVSGLQAELNSKAAIEHTHEMLAVNGLQTALNSKASAAHTHALVDVNGLQSVFNSKADTVHGHGITAILGLQTELDAKAPSSHSHAIAEVSGLQTSLDAKAPSAHSHSVAAIAGLQSTIDSLQSQIIALQQSGGSGGGSIQALVYTVSQSSVATTWAGTQAGTYAMLTDGSYATGTFTNSSSSDWIQFDLGSEKEISRLQLGGGAVTGAGNSTSWLSLRTIQVSLNMTDWTNLLSLPDMTPDRLANFTIPTIRCRYIRLAGSTRVSISEFYVWGR